MPRSTLDDLDHHIIPRIQIKSAIKSTSYIVKMSRWGSQDDLLKLKSLVNEN